MLNPSLLNYYTNYKLRWHNVMLNDNIFCITDHFVSAKIHGFAKTACNYMLSAKANEKNKKPKAFHFDHITPKTLRITH